MPTRALLLALLVAIAGCGGDDGGIPDATGPTVNTAAAVREVAAAVYGAVEADGEVAAYVEAVMLAFGVPANSEPAALDARLAARLPAFTTPQTLDLAAAYAHDDFVELDNFLAALTDYGVHRGDGGPLDRGWLDGRFAPLLGQASYADDQVLGALVLALTAERVARHGGGVDPLWGDGLLDPLQTTLLLYAIGAEVSGVSAPAPAPVSARRHDGPSAIIRFTLDRIRGRAEDAVTSQIEWPIGPDDLAQSAPCVSLALYGHQLTVTATPGHLWHQQVDSAAPPPFGASIDASLRFQDDYWDNYPQTQGWIASTLVGLAGCRLPRAGTVPGKPLTWSVGANLEPHGSYDFAQSVTGDDGQAVGHWGAVAETTPVQYRTPANLEAAYDWIKVRAGNLVPGWNTLALVAGGIRRAPDTGRADLLVSYYRNPCAGAQRLAGPGQCIDQWHGDAEGLTTNPDGTIIRITATGLTWEPQVTGPSGTIYKLTGGTVSYTMTDATCVLSVAPATVTFDPAGTVSSQLDYRWRETPVTFTGDGSMFWSAQMTATCPDGTSTIPINIGGQFFRAERTAPMGEVLADDYTLLGTRYVYSFHR